MSPIDWALTPLKKYADFSGRAPRAEYWWYTLMVVVAVYVVMIIERIVGVPRLFLDYGMVSVFLMGATFLPSLAAQVRRLHDTNHSGWWLVGMWVPYAFGMWSMRGLFAAVATMDPNHPDPAAVDQLVQQSSMASIGVGAIAMLIGGIFAIIMLIWFCTEGNKGDNRYGPNPYGE